VACNSVPHNDEIDRFPEYLKKLVQARVDAVIISDIGLLGLTREYAPDMEIHLSTQANAVNYAACKMWYKLGVKRIVLARELSLDEISEIRRNCPPELELEAFVHGAMCMSHSGRCLISNFLTGRDANRGNCAQACRWKYYLMEEKRQGEYFPIEETDNGTFIFNSKDLCMIEYIPDLCNAGIQSLKIEGRVKTEYYVACVTNTYRIAIDDCFKDLDIYVKNIPYYINELEKVSHREYYTGFFFGDQGAEGQNYRDSSYIRDYEVVALILGYDSLKRRVIVTQRNKFTLGEVCEIFEAGKPSYEFTIRRMYDSNGESILAAPHAEMKVEIELEHYVGTHSFIRRKKYY
jgi:putative protease